MLSMTRIPHVRQMFAGLLLTAVCGLCGCTPNPEAQFTWRESTQDLLPEARRALQKSIVEQFGTPDNLVAWERMPVAYGGQQGTVVDPAEDLKLGDLQIAVAWNTDSEDVDGEEADAGSAAAVKPPAVHVNDELTWLSGPSARKKTRTTKITAISDDGRVLTLADKVKAPADSTFVVNFGEQLQLGRMVYMKNCMHCHGVSGDGAGPTAKYLNPLPRDYRLGVFKFTETMATERVTRDDLWRIIKDGIPGTYMPSFLLLKDEETRAVVEYVRWLAMRGEMEKRMGDELADFSLTSVLDDYQQQRNSYDAEVAAGEKPESVPNRAAIIKEYREEAKTYVEEDFADTVDGTSEFIAGNWERAQEPESIIVPSVPRVEDTQASRDNGRLLFLSDKTKCYTCHGTTGKGNGAAVEDFWPKPGSTDKYEQRGLHDVWGHVVPPRNLTLGQYRGGRRPVDVFRRIYAGIKGTPMPAFGGTVLKDEEVWDIVNFVMSLQFEGGNSPTINPPQVATNPVR